MRLILLAALILNASSVTARDDSIVAFGHNVIATRSTTGDGTIQVDGRVVHKNSTLSLDEVALVGGVPILIGKSGPGGNSCEWTPFIISFPEGKTPRFDGPVDTCWLVTHNIERDRITFGTPAMPDADGEKWTWTPADGLKSDGKVKFVPSAEKGWADLRDRSLGHPMDLFDYGPVSTRLDQMLGDRKPQFLTAMNGPGTGRYDGDWFIGSACQRHNCGHTGAGSIVALDISGRRLFIAWKPDGKKIEVRPVVADWPSEARQLLAAWAKEFEPPRPTR